MLNSLEPPDPPANLWSRKKIALWFFGGGGGLFLILVIALLAYDEKLQPCDDLKPLRTTTPDAATNGYLFLRGRWENLPDGDKKDSDRVRDMVLGKESWDDSLVARMQSGREQIPGELKVALDLPYYQSPPIAKFNDPETPRFAWMARAYKYLGMQVLSRARAGERDAALSLLVEMHDLMVKHVGGNGSLVWLLAGISINQMTVNLTCELLSLEGFEDRQLAVLADMWSKDLPAQESWQAAMQAEAALMVQFIDVMKKNPAEIPTTILPRFSKLLFKPNMTVNRNQEQLRRFLEIAFKPFPSLAAATEAGWLGLDKRSTRFKYLDPNYAGNQLIDSDTRARILPVTRCVMLFYPRAVRVAVAVHRWRIVHPDQWPATLEELVPDFLSAIPQDPFNGQPLRWDQAARIIYSVGSDWKPDVPVFQKGQIWMSADNEAPGLRLTRDSIPAPATPAKKK